MRLAVAHDHHQAGVRVSSIEFKMNATEERLNPGKGVDGTKRRT